MLNPSRIDVPTIKENQLMPNKKDKNTTKDTRKPLPQSSIIGKRKEVFDLGSTKNKKKPNN